MSTKKLPRPVGHKNQPYEEDYAKSVAIIDRVNRMAQSDDDLALKLPPEERHIYFANRLSCQCNMDGVTNFFDHSIAPYYHTVIEALRHLEAQPMIEVLEEIRKLVMGDHEITADSIHQHAYETYPSPPYENDVPPWEADLEEVESEEADEDFHRRLEEFTISYFDSNGYSFESDD